MSKRKIITFSVIAAVFVLLAVLFGAVFCLRKTTVSFVGDYDLTITSQDIVTTANFKKGDSIFLLDKDTAIDNLESAYPYLKVVQINTVSVIQVQIVVRQRYAMYYAEYGSSYYIFDEDMKVLDIDSAQPSGLTLVDSTELGISASTKVCDFLGTEFYQDALYDLFVAVYETVQIDGEYLTRSEVSSLITSVSFDVGAYIDESTSQTVLYNRIILTTSYDVTIDIAGVETDLEYKVNYCFSALNEILTNSAYTTKTGTIKYTYLNNGVVSVVFDMDSSI